MDIMRTVRLHEIGKAAGAADARNGGDLFVPNFPLLNQLEIKREDGKVAAAGTPRRMVGGDFFFGQALAFLKRRHDGRVDDGNVAGITVGKFSGESAHDFVKLFFVAGQHAGAVEDFLHLPGQAVGFIDAPDARVAIAGAQQRSQLAVTVNAFVVQFDYKNVMKTLKNFLQAVRQRIDMLDGQAGNRLTDAARAVNGFVNRSLA